MPTFTTTNGTRFTIDNTRPFGETVDIPVEAILYAIKDIEAGYTTGSGYRGADGKAFNYKVID